MWRYRASLNSHAFPRRPAKFVFNIFVLFLFLGNKRRDRDMIFINFFILLFIPSDRAFLLPFLLSYFKLSSHLKNTSHSAVAFGPL